MPDYQLSLAIGKKGQNVRLAARLTGYKIDIRPESEVEFVDEKSDDSAKSTETTAEEDSSADIDTADEDTTVQAEEKSSEDNTEG